MMNHLIVNADDAGWSVDVNSEIFRMVDKGILASCTLMVVARQAEDFVKCYKTYHPGDGGPLAVGVHLTFVDGFAALTGKSSLTDEAGIFYESSIQKRRALKGHISVADVCAEAKAQIKLAIDMGVFVSHIDSHGHMHKWPYFASGVVKAAHSLGIKYIRRPQNIFPSNALLKTFAHGVFMGASRRGLRTTGALYCLDVSVPPATSCDLLAKRKGTIELAIHPGKKDDWRRLEMDRYMEMYRLLGSPKVESFSTSLPDWSEV